MIVPWKLSDKASRSLTTWIFVSGLIIALMLLGVWFAYDDFRQADMADGVFPLRGGALEVISVPAEQAFDLDDMRRRADWQRVVDGEVPMSGFTTRSLWVRFRIPAGLQESPGILLDVGMPLARHVDLYIPDGGEFITKRSGASVKGSQRDLLHRNFVFRLDPASIGDRLLYLRATSDHGLYIPMTMFTPAAFNQRENRLQLYLGVYLGLLMVMAGYSMVLYLSLRDRSYLYYTGVIIWLHCSSILNSIGVINYWFYADNPWLAQTQIMFSGGVTIIFTVLFAQTFLETRTTTPGMHRLLNVFLWSGIFFAVAALFGPRPQLTALLQMVMGVGILVVIATCILCLIRGQQQARFYSLAWICLLIGSQMYILQSGGLIGYRAWHTWGLLVGASMEAILLALAMGDRIAVTFRQKNEQDAELERSRRRESEASAIQSALLTPDRDVPGMELHGHYHTASTMGGDWYGSFYDKKDERLFLCVGDVTGHGMASSLITGAAAGAVQAAVQLQSGAGFAPEESLHRMAGIVNEVVRRSSGEGGRLMTMVFMLIDLKDLRAHYLNAGHNQFYLRNQQGVQAVLVTGSRLGDAEGRGFGVGSLQLDPGDSLVFFTDGLLENQGPDGRRMRISMMRAAIARQAEARSIVTNLLDSGRKIWRDTDAEDDYAVLALHIRNDWSRAS